jgi:hypothetical protein
MICAAVALAYCLAPVRAPIYMPHLYAILTRLCAGLQALVALVINFPVYIPLYSLIQYIAFFALLIRRWRFSTLDLFPDKPLSTTLPHPACRTSPRLTRPILLVMLARSPQDY